MASKTTAGRPPEPRSGRDALADAFAHLALTVAAGAVGFLAADAWVPPQHLRGGR